jgi:hypothetical protein
MPVTHVSNAAAQASVNAVLGLLDAGAGPGYIELYDLTGAAPASVDDAVVGTLLGVLFLSDPAFTAATDGTGKATANADAISNDAAANNNGTADWFRAFDSDANAVIDGDAGLAGATPALVLDDETVVTNNIIAISSWAFEQPES